MRFYLHVLIFVFSNERLKNTPPHFTTLLRHLKARALLHPFFGFNLSFPFKSGLRSRCPQMRSPDSPAAMCAPTRSEWRCHPVRVSAGLPFRQSALIADPMEVRCSRACLILRPWLFISPFFGYKKDSQHPLIPVPPSPNTRPTSHQINFSTSL